MLKRRSDIDFGAMMISEIRYDRFGLFTDFIYAEIMGLSTNRYSPQP
jgi:hypothetical protein